MKHKFALLLLIAAAGYVLWPASKSKLQMAEMPTKRVSDEDRFDVVSRGEEFNPTLDLEPGTWTLFEFGADW